MTLKYILTSLRKKQRSSIGYAALIISFFGIASRILGLIRDRMLAANFGAGDTLDVYYAAFRLPDFIFEILIVGSLAAAFIPIFNQLRAQKKIAQSWQLVHDLLLTLLLMIATLAIIGIIFAPQIMHIIVPGFTEEKITLSARLARIMFLSPIFLVISAVLGSVLVSLKRFLLYASAPLFYNIGIIIGITIITPLLHDPIGLAWGVVLGAMLHLIIHIIALRGIGWQWHIVRKNFYRTTNVKRVLRMMLPRILGSASQQLSFLLTTFFASILASGSLTIFTFAYNIQSVILGLVGVSFALAVFPALTTTFAEGNITTFNTIVERTLRRVLYYAIPLSMIFWVVRAQLVRVIYGAGHFDWNDTDQTIHILSILLFAVFAQVLIPLLARTYYAMHDTKTPLYAALFAQGVNIIIIVTCIHRFGLSAIAYGVVAATLVNAGLLFFMLSKHHVKLSHTRIYRALFFIVLASVIAAFVVHAVKTLFGTIFTLHYVWEVLAQLFFATGAGILMYLGMSSLFGLQEFDTIKKKIILRIFGRQIVAAEEQHLGTGAGPQ